MDENYSQRISRNIGLLSKEEQKILENSKIAILGTGGIGGPLALNLCYAGINNFVLADFDKIEISNLNRQPYNQEDIGKLKVDVLAENLKKISSSVNIETFYKIDEENIKEILKNVKIIALSLDGPSGSILVTRIARSLDIPIVEAWATPFIFARWFTSDSMTYEKAYDLKTENMSFKDMEAEVGFSKRIYRKFVDFVFSVPGIKEYFQKDKEIYESFLKMEISARSLAPFVWQNSIYLSFEVIFSGLLKRKEKILAPKVIAFDPFSMKIVES